MKGLKKRILSACLIVMLTIMSFSTTTFANELQKTKETICYNVEMTSEGIEFITDKNGKPIDSISPRSSISGFDQRSLTPNSAGIQVFVDASGSGGMGVTINASSSWNGYMSVNMLGSNGSTAFTGRAVYSNGETKFNNLRHSSPTYYVLTFAGIPSGQSVFVQVWIYG